jgi:hypothetical protein
MNSRGTLVKEIRMGDVEDPYLYAAFPLHEWEQTEEYKWLRSQMTEDDELVFFCDTHDYGFMIRVYAPLKGKALTFYKLKYEGVNENARLE